METGMSGLAITYNLLAGALVTPVLQYMKKHSRFFREVPLAKFITVVVLSYGAAVLYVGLTFETWQVFNQDILTGTLLTGLTAIGVNVGRKTANG